MPDHRSAPVEDDAGHPALGEVAAPRLSPEFLASLHGMGWGGDLDEMRSGDVVER